MGVCASKKRKQKVQKPGPNMHASHPFIQKALRKQTEDREKTERRHIKSIKETALRPYVFALSPLVAVTPVVNLHVCGLHPTL